jgi:hypothetical protein
LVTNLAMIHFILNDAQELLLWLNGFCFPTRRKLLIWLLVFLMPFEFQFAFIVINIVFSNFRIHFFRGLLNYAFGKGWTFVSKIHIKMMSPFNQLIIKRFDQYFHSLIIYNHTHMIMKIVRTNFMHHLIFT